MGTVRDALELQGYGRIQLGYGASVTGELAGTVALVVYAFSAGGATLVAAYAAATSSPTSGTNTSTASGRASGTPMTDRATPTTVPWMAATAIVPRIAEAAPAEHISPGSGARLARGAGK